MEERVSIDEVMDLIQLGEPLPFKVLDQQGRLLLNAGQRILNARQYELLLARGAWVERALVDALRGGGDKKPAASAPAKRLFSLFDRWERLVWDLDGVLRRCMAAADQVLVDWDPLLDEFIATVDSDADIALYVSVRQEDRRYALYPLAHSLHAAVLCLVTARQAGWTVQRQRSLVGAALSMNLSMLELQAQMAEQAGPPQLKQLDVIRKHPMAAVQQLRRTGLTDMVWLRAVAEHHEQGDGKGYPRGVVDISDEAKLLRMSDVYMAKITPRAIRAPLSPLAASGQLFKQEGGSPLALALIKAIGVHPPGSLVQLKTGEVAVVKRRLSGSGAAAVCTLSDKQGKPSPNSRTLDPAVAEQGIAGPCADPSLFPRVPGERVFGLVPG